MTPIIGISLLVIGTVLWFCGYLWGLLLMAIGMGIAAMMDDAIMSDAGYQYNSLLGIWYNDD